MNNFENNFDISINSTKSHKNVTKLDNLSIRPNLETLNVLQTSGLLHCHGYPKGKRPKKSIR